MIGRIVIDDVRPRTPQLDHPAKAVVGEVVEVSADVFRDGHDVLAARIRWRSRDNGGKWLVTPMELVVNDRWAGTVEPTTLGMHEVVVDAWTDRYATWRHKVEVKHAAGQDLSVELEEGAQLLATRRGLEAAVTALDPTGAGEEPLGLQGIVGVFRNG